MAQLLLLNDSIMKLLLVNGQSSSSRNRKSSFPPIKTKFYGLQTIWLNKVLVGEIAECISFRISQLDWIIAM